MSWRAQANFHPPGRHPPHFFRMRKKCEKHHKPACSGEIEDDTAGPWTGRKFWGPLPGSAICSKNAAELCPRCKPWRSPRKRRRGTGLSTICSAVKEYCSGRKPERPPPVPLPPTAGMSTFCSIICCSKDQDTTVGTSTSCSTSCGSRTAVRKETSSGTIMGTSITCSGSGESARKKRRSTSGNCTTICGAGSSRVRKGAKSTICCTVRRCTRACGPDTANSRSSRDPAAGTSSTSREKYSVPAAWGVGCSGTWPCSAARSHPPALAIVGLRRAEWCVYAARAMRTVCCTRLYHERSRRSLLRCAAPSTGCQLDLAMTRGNTCKKETQTCLSLLLLLLF